MYRPKPYRFTRLPESEMRARSANLLHELAQRRSVRSFSSDAVPLDVIESAVATAATAPSGAHQQPWTFVLVTSHEIKAQIRAAAEAEERESYAHRMSEEWLEALTPLGTDATKPHLTDAPCLIAVFEQVHGVVTDPQGTTRSVKHYYTRESVGIAVGMLLTALHHAGLVALTHTPSPMGFLRTLLGRPDHERPFVLIPVGYPATDATVPDLTRKPLDQVLVRC